MSEALTRSGEDLFKPARRGYDRTEVDAYVAQLQQQLRELQRQQQTPDAAVESALDRVGDEVAAILKQTNTTRDAILEEAQRDVEDMRAEAERDANEVRAQAQADAESTRERAERHAAHITAVAEQRVHELDVDTDRIWAERERIVADARDLGRQMQAVAELAAERFPQDSRA